MLPILKNCVTRNAGVEDVSADSKAHKVIVKGKKAAADPMKVVERVQKKTGRKVELLSPMLPPKEEKKEEEKKEEPEPPKPEEKKVEVNYHTQIDPDHIGIDIYATNLV
uniref:HMA domain-containing protein n=1 Tax=Arundo donax TaxID=35708 RepID=A0A0A9DMD7_ARUDO